MTAVVEVFDPLLGPEGAEAMLRLAEDFGTYRTYSEERTEDNYGDLPQRIDAAANYVRTGGRFGQRDEPKSALAARTNYFRETYAYGEHVRAAGIEPFLHHEGFRVAARALHGRDVIVPAIVYANLLLPGQELAVHTDVPEFRGANRKLVPQWLLVVMHHSGMFERWRMPIATGITYFGAAKGGALAYYVDGEPQTYEPKHNTGVLLDTDSVFHGVDRVEGDESTLARLRSGQRLHHDGGGRWSLRAGDDVIATFTTDELRYSVSWKGYCFADDAERQVWTDHTDDLTLELILDTLVADVGVERPASDTELGRLLIERYITFPAPAPSPA